MQIYRSKVQTNVGIIILASLFFFFFFFQPHKINIKVLKKIKTMYYQFFYQSYISIINSPNFWGNTQLLYISGVRYHIGIYTYL